MLRCNRNACALGLRLEDANLEGQKGDWRRPDGDISLRFERQACCFRAGIRSGTVEELARGLEYGKV